MRKPTEAQDMGFVDIPEGAGITNADVKRGYMHIPQPATPRTDRCREMREMFGGPALRGPRNTGFLGSRDYNCQEDEDRG